MRPTAESPEALLAFGWQIAEATLAEAEDRETLVTHWFLTEEDDGVNADPHFGSDARTERFISIAFPTLIDELNARAAVLATPWELDGPQPVLAVIAIGPERAAVLATRPLHPLEDRPGPPFWALGPEGSTPPAQLAMTVSRLAR